MFKYSSCSRTPLNVSVLSAVEPSSYPVITEVKLTVNPADGYHLKECKEHDGHYSSVMVHQLENIDAHLKRDVYYYNIGGIPSLHDHKQFIDAHKLQSDCTCMTHGIPKTKAATHTARTNSSFHLNIWIIFCWNSSSRLVTSTSTMANYDRRMKNKKNKWGTRLLQLL